MTRAYVLMTAMPPTKGHLHLIQYAARLADSAEVIVCTQPSEPFAYERLAALRDATRGLNVNFHHIHKELPQEPEVATGFWDMWLDFLQMFGLQSSDLIVASEMYGRQLATISGAAFMPYDIDRSIYSSKATLVRRDPRMHFEQVLPEFQKYLTMRVTVFGAESTGKTTLSRNLSGLVDGHWLFEYARPYLETVGTEITTESMTAIWRGQRALQSHAEDLHDKPFIVQDTDLFSTVGYWDFWDMRTPDALVQDAINSKSDLYVVTPSNIPFEPDPLRYGGDKREADDEYWIGLLEKYSLPYVVLDSSNLAEREIQALEIINRQFDATRTFAYERRGQ